MSAANIFAAGGELEARLGSQAHLEDLCALALTTWGAASQLAMCEEEAAELIQAILHHRRGRADSLPKLMEEAADTYITIRQVRLLSPACFDEWVKDKLARLRGLLEADHV